MGKNEETELSWLQGLGESDTSTTREDIEGARRAAGAAARENTRVRPDAVDGGPTDHDDWLRSLGRAEEARRHGDSPAVTPVEDTAPEVPAAESHDAVEADPVVESTDDGVTETVVAPAAVEAWDDTVAADVEVAEVAVDEVPVDAVAVVEPAEDDVPPPSSTPVTGQAVSSGVSGEQSAGPSALDDVTAGPEDVTAELSDDNDQVFAELSEDQAEESVVEEPVAPAPKKKSRWRKPAIIASAATVLVLGAGGGIALALTKEITVQADGQTVTVSTFAGDVAGALAAAQISLGQYDQVSPSLTDPIADDDVVVVDRARLVTVALDGELHETWTTADTLDQALTELGVAAGDGERLELSADRAAAIPATGLTVDAVITFPVTLVDGAQAPAELRTEVDTVAELLAANGIEVDDDDVVTPAGSTALTPGATVSIDRVLTESVTEQVEVAQPADQTVEDPALNQGVTEVAEAGNPGTEAVTFAVTTVNGAETARVETAREVQVAAKATVVRVGTRVPDPSEKYADSANWSVNWDGIARCESTNNWAINTGNGYYGGLQFDRGTWLGAGGGTYGATANLATKEQQIYIAEKVYASRGLQPWACGHAG